MALASEAYQNSQQKLIVGRRGFLRSAIIALSGAVLALPRKLVWAETKTREDTMDQVVKHNSDTFRRVVTEIGADGRSRVATDANPRLVMHPRHPMQSLTQIWSTRTVPANLKEDGDAAGFVFPPPRDGVVVVRNYLPPDSVMPC